MYDPEVPGAKEVAEHDYRRHNGLVADGLRAAGLLPEGDINASLRTGGRQQDDEESDEGSEDR